MMADVVKIATRDSYGNAVTALAAEHDDILVLDADLAGATKTAIFKKAYPDRHINCGIAEADLIGVSAGLSTMGFVPFCSSFAMFAAGRAYEQVRNTVGYPHLNVKICATHGGISVGEDGASHQCCEDFALMRTIPGMVVLSPADDVEARAAVKAAYEHKGPVYIRFGRAAVPVIHEEENYSFEIGKAEVLRPGTDVAVAATGLMVAEALKAAETLAAEGINVRVINVCSIKPLDEETILAAARECGKIVACEEHSIIGGLGEAVCSLVSEKHPVPVRRVGVNDEFGHSARRRRCSRRWACALRTSPKLSARPLRADNKKGDTPCAAERSSNSATATIRTISASAGASFSFSKAWRSLAPSTAPPPPWAWRIPRHGRSSIPSKRNLTSASSTARARTAHT